MYAPPLVLKWTKRDPLPKTIELHEDIEAKRGNDTNKSFFMPFGSCWKSEYQKLYEDLKTHQRTKTKRKVFQKEDMLRDMNWKIERNE